MPGLPLDAETLTRPGLLLLAIPAVLWVVVSALGSRSLLGPRALVLATLARAALVAGLLVLLAEPSGLAETRAPGRLEALVDVSRSIGDEALRLAAEDLGRRARAAAAEPACELEVAAFAGAHRVVYGGLAADLDVDALVATLLDPQLRGDLGPLASDPRTGLAALAAAAAPDRDVVRLLYSDGLLAAPPAEGMRLGGRSLALPVFAAAEDDVALLALEVPEQIAAGEPCPVRIRWRSQRARDVEILLAVDGIEVDRISCRLEPGEGEVEIAGRDLALAPGFRVLGARLLGGDAEPGNDAVAGGVEVLPESRTLYVAGAEGAAGRAPAPLRALRAQEVPVREVEAASLPEDLRGYRTVRAVVLDRVGPDELVGPRAEALARFVDQGGGLLVLPRERKDELLAWNRHALGPLLPLRGLPAPEPPPKEPEPRRDDEPPPERLAPPDPEKSKVEEKEAPTLSVLLVIDKSPSMKRGSRLHFAKLGALATARKLHPEDRIGVIAYNEVPIEAVPMQPAANLPDIEAAVMRIEGRGRATDIRGALEYARQAMAGETSAVKTVILLSDGYTIPFEIEPVLTGLVADGISVSTVGVGSDFDITTLTQIARYGRGTGPIPARSAREIPSVLVDLTSGMIEKEGLRRRPPERRREDDGIERPERTAPPEEAPRPRREEPGAEERKGPRLEIAVARGVTYTDGLPWRTAPPLREMHGSTAKGGAWVALVAGKGEGAPLLAHWRVGDGLVALSAAAPEGPAVGDLPLWEGYGPFLAQALRFLERDPSARRLALVARAGFDRLIVEAVDARVREPGPWDFEAEDDEGALDLAARRIDDERWELVCSRPLAGVGVRVRGRPAGAEEDGLSPAEDLALIPRPPEVARRGFDLTGLEAWGAALGGDVGRRGEGGPLPATRTGRRRAPIPALAAAWLLLIFLGDVALKRLGRRIEA